SFAYFSVLFAVHVVGIMTFLLGAVPPLLLKDHGGVFMIMTIVSGSMAVLASGILILASLLLQSWMKDIHYTILKTTGSFSEIVLPFSFGALVFAPLGEDLNYTPLFADWLRISSGSYAAGGIYHGRPLEYPAKIHVRSKLHYFPLIKDRLNEARRSLFRTTCFGPWLDISYVENDDGMIHYVLQKQSFSDDESFDLPLIYHLNGHSLHFGRRQFCLVTGFKFGLISLREHRNGDIPFRNRLFPEKIGFFEGQ
ncbi:hypothetical protein Tco_1168244, partial [Tanacetum coccineum]